MMSEWVMSEVRVSELVMQGVMMSEMMTRE